ncbi:MAG TPA: MFS transporter [Candidatus Limnocylindria bacterium]|nr:MFS transporter [Candidatus Limnocylindria bacterium]
MSFKTWTLVATCLGSGIVFLDSTVVTVAMPRIGHDLPATLFGVLEGQSYVYTGYLLALSALLILAGALSDHYGRRRVFTIGVAAFGLTSVLCGLAPTMEWLVAFRLLQGAAGAILVPGSLAILTATFRGEEQGRAFGIWASASAVTTLLGPPLGGLLVDTVSWRAAFLINVPFVIVTLWATRGYVRESRDETSSAHFDWLGAALVALGVGGLSFGAIYGQQREWRDPEAFVALAVGALATVAFPFVMARRRHPLVPLGLFGSRNFAVTNLATLLIYGALYVFSYFLALFQQGTLGYTATAAGLAGVPITVVLVAISPRMGALAARYGARIFMTAGPALMALGTLLVARVPASSGPWGLRLDDPGTFVPSAGYLVDFMPGLIAFAVGLGIMVAPLTTALMTSVPKRSAGVGSAVNNAISRIGPQLAGALIFVVITAAFYASLAQRVPGLDVSDPAVRQRVTPLNAPKLDAPGAARLYVTEDVLRAAREASTEAFRSAMLACFALLAAGAAVSWVGIRDADVRAGAE